MIKSILPNGGNFSNSYTLLSKRTRGSGAGWGTRSERTAIASHSRLSIGIHRAPVNKDASVIWRCSVLQAGEKNEKMWQEVKRDNKN